jgi:hypothetical protein
VTVTMVMDSGEPLFLQVGGGWRQSGEVGVGSERESVSVQSSEDFQIADSRLCRHRLPPPASSSSSAASLTLKVSDRM